METTNAATSQGAILPPGDDLLYEVVDGQVVELAPMGAYDIWLATVLATHLETCARQYRLGRAVQAMLFDLGPVVQRQRRPDVAFVSYDRWPRQRRIPRTEAWEVVPNLAVEVISRTDSMNETVNKVTEYFRAGVECVWLVFPAQEQVYIYESSSSVRILTRTDEWRGEPVLPHFRLPLAALFDEVEETEPQPSTMSSLIGPGRPSRIMTGIFFPLAHRVRVLTGVRGFFQALRSRAHRRKRA